MRQRRHRKIAETPARAQGRQRRKNIGIRKRRVFYIFGQCREKEIVHNKYDRRQRVGKE